MAARAAPEAPTVSVIVPFLDPPAEFFEEAIASVLGQTFPSWELLLVDDGSAAEIGEIARSYAAHKPRRIRYLEHEGHRNRGPSPSRNLALRHARGRYVAFLDADDVWLPGKLAVQVALLERRPEAAMVYGASLYWYGWTGSAEDRKRDFIPSVGVRSEALFEPPALLTRWLQGTVAVPPPCSVLANRAAMERIGGFEDGFTGIYEDQVFLAKLALRYPILVANRCWDRYRQHARSACATASVEEERESRQSFLAWLDEWLTGSQGAGRRVRRVVRQAIRREQAQLRHPAWGRLLRGGRRMRRRIGELLHREPAPEGMR